MFQNPFESLNLIGIICWWVCMMFLIAFVEPLLLYKCATQQQANSAASAGNIKKELSI